MVSLNMLQFLTLPEVHTPPCGLQGPAWFDLCPHCQHHLLPLSPSPCSSQSSLGFISFNEPNYFCLLHPLPGVCFPTHFHVATSFPSCTCSPVGGSQARVSLGSPGRLVKQRLGCSVRICISHRFKGDANGAVQGPQLSLTHYSQ